MTDDDHHNSSLHFSNDTFWHIYDCTLDLDYNSRRVGLFLLYLLVFVAGLPMNAVVVWVNWRWRHSRNTALFCLLHVGLSDLVIMVVMPFQMLEVVLDHVWLWGQFLCRFSAMAFRLNMYSSSFFLAYMTVERYLAVRHGAAPRPWGPAEKRKRALISAGLWLLSITLALFETVHVRLLEFQEPGCYILPLYSIVEWYATLDFMSLLFQFAGPAAIIITFNLLTARAVRASPEAAGGQRVWLLHVYSLVFVLCWLPLHMVTLLIELEILNPLLMSCNTVEQLFFSNTVVHTVSLFHCIANPVLYNFLRRSFHGDLSSAIARHLPRESGVRAELGGNNAAQNGATAEGGKARKMSDTSTSQSEVDS